MATIASSLSVNVRAKVTAKARIAGFRRTIGLVLIRLGSRLISAPVEVEVEIG